MRRNGGSSNPAHEIGGEREHPHLERHRHSDGPTKRDQSPDPLPVEAPPMAEQVETPELPVGGHHRNERAAKCQPSQSAPQAAADEPERGKAEMAEDQRPAEERIETDPPEAQPQNDSRPLERRD